RIADALHHGRSTNLEASPGNQAEPRLCIKRRLTRPGGRAGFERQSAYIHPNGVVRTISIDIDESRPVYRTRVGDPCRQVIREAVAQQSQPRSEAWDADFSSTISGREMAIREVVADGSDIQTEVGL